MSKLEVVILAAGKGTRMRSTLPKVLHRLANKPLLQHVIDTAYALIPHAVHVVYGHGGELVKQGISDEGIQWAEQAEQLGTGHAVEQAVANIEDDSTVLVLYGDVPLVTAQTLQALMSHVGDGIALLTMQLDNPDGYGRIVRNIEGKVERIVEQKDASADELAITEVNTGILAVDGSKLRSWLRRLENSNAQGEYYLTDIIAMAVADGFEVSALVTKDEAEVAGVNDRVQLAQLERVYQQRQAERLMRAGVTLLDPNRFDLRGTVECGTDVVIDTNVILQGKVKLGSGVSIGSGSILTNVVVGDGVEIAPMSVIEDAVIGNGCAIGPFARIRPGTELADKAKVGNFVEIKNSQIGTGSKVNHLSYIGDTTMGAEVNIGAGTITCNYDGANKHRTVIGDNAFIGSDSQLVAPVTIGEGATIGAGATITKDVGQGELSLSRVPQRAIKGWRRPKKEK
ncbi:MAG: bifunctional UDP-N-acetylglucosamine diphosphorylase/glucosamine-1-phosphate N-acetyltransferase GlmU [Chromatiales bacterium]|nr:bifunctional UDP-N-acetylglucosamine diphosphorylase/glucosamine-1-phosphate N-acetyltransferase GlmU [Chromatiales bacterium]